MVEHAIVKFFDEREGKRFGFAYVLDEHGERTGEEIFFHANDRSCVLVGRHEPRFKGSYTWTGSDDTRYLLGLPEEDDEIVFDRADGKEGDKACPWGYASSWHRAEERIENRPVIRVTKSSFAYGDNEEPKVIWQGTDRMDLTARFPRRPKRSHDGYDTLASWSADGGQLGSSGAKFEVLVVSDDGEEEWERTSDPRFFDCCVPRRELKRHNPGWQQTTPCRHVRDQHRVS